MRKFLFFILIMLCALSFPCFAQKKNGAKKTAEVDLTRMSATMVYAKVFDMLINPDSYEGRKIRIKGMFDVFEFEQNGSMRRSFACIVQDATACCAQGMEFILAGNPSYPSGYPDRYAEITISGTFHQFEEDGLNRILLTDCTLF